VVVRLRTVSPAAAWAAGALLRTALQDYETSP
jgi:hypothetical protein